VPITETQLRQQAETTKMVDRLALLATVLITPSKLGLDL
jgi:hypothetical protein